MMAITYGLVFYVVGVETSFLASPIFSMFFIINYNTVHGVVIYVVLAAAAALSATNLTLTLMKKRKLELPQILHKPVIRMMKTPDGALAGVSLPTNTLKIVGKPKNNKIEQKNRQATRSVMRPTDQPAVQTASGAHIVKDTTINQKAGVNEREGRFVCPACKKEFSTPLFMLEYSSSTQKLIRHCPYCDQALD